MLESSLITAPIEVVTCVVVESDSKLPGPRLPSRRVPERLKT